MPARSDRGIVTIRDVTRTAVSSIHVSAETNSRNSRRAVFCAVRDEELSKGQRRWFESVEIRHASLPRYELGSWGIVVRRIERVSWVGSCSGELNWEFQSWQLADDGEIERVQLRVGSPSVRKNLYVRCGTVALECVTQCECCTGSSRMISRCWNVNTKGNIDPIQNFISL
jgi:hypothetical protein